MAETIAFVTGRMARPRLEAVLHALEPAGFEWHVCELGVKVAALMTTALIARRLELPAGTDRVVLPGRCRVDLAALAARFGVPFERGPDEVADLPRHFGRKAKAADLSRHDVRLFAEIVDAPRMTVAAIVERAALLRAAGADVIDLGCLPDTPFPHLEDAVAALKGEGRAVSVDSADAGELRRALRAGADFVLSLTRSTLHLLDEGAATPVLIPEPPGDLDSLVEAVDRCAALGRDVIADPVLDPIHFGFTASIGRYAALRERRPGVEMLMGTGNLTELTEADSLGVTAVLMGIVSELRIRNVLTVQVSPHTRRTLEEHDAARRLMFAARADASLPKGYGDALLALHDRLPFVSTPDEVAAQAEAVRDANYRIEAAADGVHVYNRDGHHVARDIFALYPGLGVEADGAHAFYLGAELARAEIAWQLGKRYAQDTPLRWGVAAPAPAEESLIHHAPAGETLAARRRREEKT